MTLQPAQFSPSMMPKQKPVQTRAEQFPAESGYMMHPHAAKQATMKGFPHAAVLAAANDPQTTYENGRYPGQMRHIRDNIVAVVEPATRQIRTVYENVKETALRADQTDKDAQKYGRNRARA